MSDAEETESSNAIAIVGMAGRFPGAGNVEQFWCNVRDGIDSVLHATEEELAALGIDAETRSNPNYVTAAGLLEGVEFFDAPFFGVNPREAELTDPQHRIFLECAWEALENSGYDPERFDGRIGVYAGESGSKYLFNLLSNPHYKEAMNTTQVAIGNVNDFLTTLVSYKLNLKGPSLTVQTACSTSLVAVHLACQGLLNGECDMALAGGVSIKGRRRTGYFYEEGSFMSPDGRCRAFDAKARGTSTGSGVGIAVLKRLEDALLARDDIHAVIKGSAINNDGSRKVGYTAPSVDGQASVITEARAMADVDPDTISYVEAHGTGTPLGDPIEIAALTQSFRAATSRKRFCALGSVKTNIGHLDRAAGIAGLIKTVLALKHRMIPPSLYFESPNPQIDFANSPFFVNTSLRAWETGGAARRAAVSSFGIGGTNAHVVLEEAPVREPGSESRPWQLLLLSAKTRPALDALTAGLSAHLESHTEVNLADAAYTLQVGRAAFAHRRAVVCDGLEDAAQVLRSHASNRVSTAHVGEKERPLVFMFPGQGAQYVNMGRELYEREEIFRRNVRRCCEILRAKCGLGLEEVLYPGLEGEGAEQLLRQTRIAQPALFVVEYSLARMWMAWGVRPHAMIGHSIGEYVAACLSQVFSLEDALSLVAVRGELMQEMPTGAMLSVGIGESELQPIIEGEPLWLAAVNAPQHCVVSGAVGAIDELERRLAAQSVECNRLHTSHAYHSEMMGPTLAPFAKAVGKINLSAPRLPYISNVTGRWATAAEATDADYWARHLRQTVRFGEGVRQLLEVGEPVFLEVGPGQTLSTLVRRQRAEPRLTALPSLRHPHEQVSDQQFLLNALGRLWLAGARVDWESFSAGERRLRVPLNTYPFERHRYWVEPHAEGHNVAAYGAPLRKKPDIADWFYLPCWKQSAPPELAPQAAPQSPESSWLIFADMCGVGQHLAERLGRTGRAVTTVSAGEKFAMLRENAFVINPRRREDYDALFGELERATSLPNRIAHLWSVTPDGQTKSGIESFEATQETGFYSLLFTAQALGERELTEPIRLGVVSNHVQSVTGDERLCPEKATVLGPCLVIPRDYPQINARSIDIVIPEPDGRQWNRLIDQLVAELTADLADSVVAYRGAHRWVRTFEAARLDKPQQTHPRLRDGGVYLITGGLGGIGLVLAEHLARDVKAKLILTGRAALPERGKWAGWLAAHADDDDTSRKIRKVQELETLGAEVMIFSADITDAGAMRGVLRQATARFGKVQGVIHAAGVPGGGMIQLRTPEAAASVIAPKVKGALVLDALLGDANLDFLVLCSSLNSFSPALGQVDYCGANAFLDAFAHYRSARNGGVTVSVNWDAWQEVGMAVNTAVSRDRQQPRAESLKLAILPREGVNVFDRILCKSLPQVAVSTVGLQRAENATATQTASKLREQSKATDTSQAKHERPALGNTLVTPRNPVEQALTEIWQSVLGIEQVGVTDNFFDLGGHSLLATQLISLVRHAFQVSLSLRVIYERPTITDWVWAILEYKIEVADTCLLTGMIDEIKQLSDEEVRTALSSERGAWLNQEGEWAT